MPMPRTSLAAALAASLAAAAPAAAELTADEVKKLAIEAILENPEVVMQAVDILRARDEAAQASATAAAIDDLRAALETDPDAPVLGNPDGDVVMVEFFDYNCPYCKRAADEVKALIAADPGVKVVYREWPILGEGSVAASRAALAARNQDRYDDLHWALMAHQGRKDEAAVLAIAAELGLDVERLKSDMTSDKVDSHIARSMELAQALGFTGTPAFVVGGQPAFGLLGRDQLAAMVAEARAEAE